MTHEQFITKETAKLAKQAGFDWEVNSYLSYYGNCPDNPHWAVSVQQEYKDWNNYKFKHILEAYSAPTQSVLQRWLREIKGISVEVCHVIVWVEGGTLGIKWCYRICYLNFNESDILSSDDFNTYEAALEASLRKCLTLLIEKQ